MSDERRGGFGERRGGFGERRGGFRPSNKKVICELLYNCYIFL